MDVDMKIRGKFYDDVLEIVRAIRHRQERWRENELINMSILMAMPLGVWSRRGPYRFFAVFEVAQHPREEASDRLTKMSNECLQMDMKFEQIVTTKGDF